MKLIGEINPKLTPAHREAVIASSSERMGELTLESIGPPMVDLLVLMGETLGQKFSNSTATVVILRKELKDNYSKYTIQEVRLACMMGVTGKLCELTELTQPVISVTNICKFIHLYNEQQRKYALHEQRIFDERITVEKEAKRTIEGNARLDQEINDCLIAYRLNPDHLNGINENLKECYFERLRKRQNGKILELEIMNQIFSVAECQILTFEELSDLQKHKLRNKTARLEWDKSRKIEVRTRARSIALIYVFDNLK